VLFPVGEEWEREWEREREGAPHWQ
jgi:hypothetical protein